MTLDASRTRATSLDVARLAGLSRSTVSQVLNGNRDRFPQETQDRVEAAAAELGYRPSRAGRALVSGVSDLIVVAVPNVTYGRHLQDAVDRIAAATASRGMSVVVRYAGRDLGSTLTAVLDLRPAVVVDLGVFVDPHTRRVIEAGGTRIVPDLAQMSSTTEHPYRLVGRLQVDHLLRRPERRLVIAMLSDDRPEAAGPERHQGVVDAARAAGHPDPLTISVPLELDGAREALSGVLALAPDLPLGVCCYNDDVAIAVMAAARELGLNVPDDVAVVGVDRTAIGRLIEPALTSIAIDFSSFLADLLGDVDTLRDADAPAAAHLDFGDYVRLVNGGSS